MSDSSSSDNEIYLTVSYGIPYIHCIEQYLGKPVVHYNSAQRIFKSSPDQTVLGVLSWGRKQSVESQELASKFETTVLYLEDGFLRSLSSQDKYIPLSLIADDMGIYYDATQPSRLEYILNNLHEYLDNTNIQYNNLIAQSQAAQEYKFEHNLSKYNNSVLEYYNDNLAYTESILLVDQVYDDLSIKYGMANKKVFAELYADALIQNPECNIFIKLHPANKDGYLRKLLDELQYDLPDNIYIVDGNYNAISLLKDQDINITKVYCVTSHLGFEALLAGKQVYTYGAPFYAGWGLTHDIKLPDLVKTRRSTTRSIDELFAVSYILLTKYINPVTHKETNILNTLTRLKKQSDINIKNAGKIYCFGFNWFSMQSWKRNRIRQYLKSTSNTIYFPENIKQAQKLGLNQNSKIYVWGSRDDLIPGLKDVAASLDITIGHIEDGFIRSVGLGTDFVPPLSLAVDSSGIYYNPHEPSDLVDILNNNTYTDQDIQRAQELMHKITSNNITKYNVQTKQIQSKDVSLKFKTQENQRIILVPGQVPKDASIIKACKYPVNSNYRLLKEVRESNPDAFIIFKIHPDLLVQNRSNDYMTKQEFLTHCDYIDSGTNASELIQYVDEVHTMSSQLGFEALLRNKTVHTYGSPFYAGWGLTHDALDLSNTRFKSLSIEELFLGCMVDYPVYYDNQTKSYCMLDDCLELILQILQSQESQTESVLQNSQFTNYIRRRLTQGHGIWTEMMHTLFY